jgi:hypothetical protein
MVVTIVIKEKSKKAMKKIHVLQGAVASVFVAVAALSPLSALNARAEEAQSNRAAAAEKVQEKKVELAAKLDAKKLQICEKKQSQIQSRIAKMSSQGAKQLEVFSKIADRVQEFKTTRNYTVDNYDALLAALDEKRIAAQTAVAEATESGQAFNCGADNPRGIAAQFQERLKQQIRALKEYKTSVKDLIVAVKSSNDAKTDTQEEVTNE